MTAKKRAKPASGAKAGPHDGVKQTTNEDVGEGVRQTTNEDVGEGVSESREHSSDGDEE